ncbi:hypothetical protein SAMN05443575_0446 [Jatrophihabitans endophyticus]|uniref:Uncharacterized protein n=1 Tax=Jatrophihabitans endophyticus TaxID=1206085 RepID=A0A1M5D3V4_9ACTN|nr:hypothetical protein [Jatrophihabitans endophyticus]SHF61621.1 hypothetical protein SAMN05443575_0446 [Jatrophihabitans endophyticus]
MADDAASIGWPELIVLMGFGDDGGGMRGTFHVRETTQLDDDIDIGDEDVEDEDVWWDHVETHPTLGRLAVVENHGRLTVQGDSHRLESMSGQPWLIETPDDRWLVAPGGEQARHDDRSRLSIGYTGGWPDDLVGRLMPSRWEGNDFTRLTGPATRIEFLGRPAWAFELAAPRHKPHPLQLVVDAATGRVLSYRNDDFGSVTEWTSVEFGVDLPQDTFRWTGPVVEFDPDADEPEPDGDTAWRGDWLASHGLADVTVPVALGLELRDADDAGAFHADFFVELDGAVLRRPASDEPWPAADQLRYDDVRRWRDDGWDWCLATSVALTEPQFAALRGQLCVT